MPKVATGTGQRAVGVQVNMEGYTYWSRAAVKAKAEVEVTARAIRQMPSVKSLVERCGKAVGWKRLLYRLRLLSVPGGGQGRSVSHWGEHFYRRWGCLQARLQQRWTLLCGWQSRMSLQWRGC